MRKLIIAALAALVAVPAYAQQKLDFILNWVPGGDHAPYYFARKMGWYAKEGIDLNLEPGKGSMLAVQKVGAGANPIGLADMGNVLIGKGKGTDAVGVFNVYANSPQGLYWLKSSGIKGVKDPKPCVQALVDANGALKFDNELTNWGLVEVLMSDKSSTGVALGIHDDARMQADYELVRDFVGIDKPFEVKTVYTNEFLDRKIKMTK